ncbi:protein kinase [Histoplasma capsulatum H143]|uniref:cyclin-dependent kinase n=1 Tax=Ajellomyces capsulatus (strain H143) TaxID=544712 RepID=C6HI35_AJECH|nr:protein kinase [Histoplasma capsulatum H143]
MSTAPRSRWAEDDAETEALIEQKRREKEERKRIKAEKQRRQQEEAQELLAQTHADQGSNNSLQTQEKGANGDAGRPSKRRRLSNEPESRPDLPVDQKPNSLLRFPAPEWGPCRHVDNFERLNRIEEGSYGLTSNLLMNNRGEIKVADFGMARYYGDPPPKLTQLVTTLWYRSPELLLGAETYGPEIDMWSIGCIFAELVTKKPLFQGENEVSQLSEIFASTGPPTTQSWPSFRSLPNAKFVGFPANSAAQNSDGGIPLLWRKKFPYLTTAGLTLLSHLLALNPASRPDAATCLSHPYFREDPKPKAKEMFPTFPSKAGMERRRRRETPEAPKRGDVAPRLDFAKVFGGVAGGVGDGDGVEAGAGFTLRLG